MIQNYTDNVNDVKFVSRKHMSPEGPIFSLNKRMNRGKETVLPSLSSHFPLEKALSDTMATY